MMYPATALLDLTAPSKLHINVPSRVAGLQEIKSEWRECGLLSTERPQFLNGTCMTREDDDDDTHKSLETYIYIVEKDQ